MAVTEIETSLVLGCSQQRSHHGKQRTEQEQQSEENCKVDAERKACKEGREEEVLVLLKDHYASFVSKVFAAFSVDINFFVLRLSDRLAIYCFGNC